MAVTGSESLPTSAPWRRRVHRAAVTIWVLAALVLVADLINQRFFSDEFSCLLQNTSALYGEARWSWVPMGRACTYRLETGPWFTTEPYAYTIWLQAAVGAGAFGYLIARLRHRP